MSTSALFHVCLVVAASLYVFAPKAPDHFAGMVEGTLSPESVDDIASVASSILTLEPGPAGGGAGGAVEHRELAAARPPIDAAVAANAPAQAPRLITSDSTPALNWSSDWQLSRGLTDVVGPVVYGPEGIERSAGEGAGTGNGKGRGDGTATFFGIHADGRRIVYLVDASNSMNRPYEGEGKTRFGQMKLELAKSILALKDSQQFFVIFFNERAIPMPSPGLESAFPPNQRQFLNWVASVPANGLTDPRPAMSLALQLNPDVVYLLTDGAFPRDVESDFRSLRQRQTQIHTIAFGDPKAERLLKPLAFHNHGRFAFVP